MKAWLKSRFIAGFFVTVPAFATAWLLWLFWSRIDDIFAPMYERILGRPVPGLGFLTAIAVILETVDGKAEMVTVFTPTNNLCLSDIVVVPRADVIATGLTVEEGVRII